MNHKGAKQQFVFHRKQFVEEDFKAVTEALEKYK